MDFPKPASAELARSRRRPQALLFGAGEVHPPVDLPALAAVGREGLLPMRGGRCDARPGEAHPDGLVVEGVVALEGADAVLEIADHRRLDLVRVAAVEPEDRPGLRLGIVAADSDRAVRTAWQADIVVVHGAVTVHRHPQ